MIDLTDLLLFGILLALFIQVLDHSPSAGRMKRKPGIFVNKLKNKLKKEK